jgi:hypothetical protein
LQLAVPAYSTHECLTATASCQGDVMKLSKLCLFAAALGFAVPATAQAGEALRLSEPVQETEEYEIFGAPVEELGEPVGLAQLIGTREAPAERQVYARATVAQVCQKKGCFFVAQDGEAVARVTFLDYGFFVPTDSGGKEVTIVGKLSRKQLTEAQARHFAADLGQDPDKVTGGRSEYSIVATSVIVPKS